jgi:hypothetical protein
MYGGRSKASRAAAELLAALLGSDEDDQGNAA